MRSDTTCGLGIIIAIILNGASENRIRFVVEDYVYWHSLTVRTIHGVQARLHEITLMEKTSPG